MDQTQIHPLEYEVLDLLKYDQYFNWRGNKIYVWVNPPDLVLLQCDYFLELIREGTGTKAQEGYSRLLDWLSSVWIDPDMNRQLTLEDLQEMNLTNQNMNPNVWAKLAMDTIMMVRTHLMNQAIITAPKNIVFGLN